MAVEYNQHTWGYGEEFTPDKLNNIEGGIKANADAINEVNNNLTGNLRTIWISDGSSYSFEVGKSGALIFCPRGEWGVMTDYYSPSWTALKGTIYSNFTIAKNKESYKVDINNKTGFTVMLFIINSGEAKTV